MIQCKVDGLIFSFPENWKIAKYDDWAFYRNQFSRMWNEIKAVDMIALDLSSTFWLIEVKDYRVHRRTKPTCLPNEVAGKVFDTLAAMLPAKINASNVEEKQMASDISSTQKIRVVLHLEQPPQNSKLFRRAIDPADVQQKIRKLIHPVDAHPKVVEKSEMRNLEWSVR
ncbi:MAG: hypothetical protein JW764_02605 [Chlorobiaceae bacterium]|nr:hypothetical protein [Chlorobiaceae bacterium]